MAKWSLQCIINHHKGIEVLDPMFLYLPGIESDVHGNIRLGLACCEAIEDSGMPLTVELLKETIASSCKILKLKLIDNNLQNLESLTIIVFSNFLLDVAQ